MRETRLIDMSGLSGDPSSDDLLDDLFFRLESEILNAPGQSSKRSGLSSCMTMVHLTGTPVKGTVGGIRMITRRRMKAVARSATSRRMTQ